MKNALILLISIAQIFFVAQLSAQVTQTNLTNAQAKVKLAGKAAQTLKKQIIKKGYKEGKLLHAVVMKLTYVSADGKTVWISEKIKNIAKDCDVLWDDAGFVLYDKNSAKKTVEFWQFDYRGKMTASAESKFEYPVLSIFRSSEKQIAILESDKKQLKKLYIQELTPKTFVLPN